MPSYTLDASLQEVASKVIQVDRRHLQIMKIAYMFRPEAPVSDGKATAGMCIRLDDRNYTIHGYDFVIEIAKDIWEEADEKFRLALMDHELGHIGIRYGEDGQPEMDEKSGRIKTYCKKHDIEEFEDVLERHGDYHPALRSFLRAFAKRKEDAKKPKKKEEATAGEDGGSTED